MQLTAAAVTPPAEHAARRPAGEADASAADAGVRLNDGKAGARRRNKMRQRFSVLIVLFSVIALHMNVASGCASSSRATIHNKKYRPSEVAIEKQYTKYEAFDKGKLQKAPKLLHYETPDYPLKAKQAGYEGTVVIAVLIGTNVRVEDVRLVATDITPMMEKAVMIAARKFIYRPGERRSKPVRCWGIHSIRFALNDDAIPRGSD
jgi:TonB family protein